MELKDRATFESTVVQPREADHYVTVRANWSFSAGGSFVGYKQEKYTVFISQYSDIVDREHKVIILNEDFDAIARGLGYVKQEEVE